MSEADTYSPVKVHIVGTDVHTPEKRPEQYRTSHRTIVLSASVPSYEIAGYDALRKEIRMTVADNPVVISADSGQANAAENLAAGLLTPRGRYVPVESPEIVIPGCDAVWVTAAAYPTRVGVTIVRCI